MLVKLDCDEWCETARTVEISGDFEITGTLSLNENSISSLKFSFRENADIKTIVEPVRDCHSFKSTLESEGFWKKTRKLSVTLKMKPSKRDSGYLKIHGESLTELCRIFGSDLRVDISMHFSNDLLDSKVMPVISAPNDQCKRSKFETYCEDHELELNEGDGSDWFEWMLGTDPDERKPFSWFIMTLSGSFCKSICDSGANNASGINAKMLNDKIGTDVEMLAMDGTSISCHRAFLMDQSSVFAAMFSNDFLESKTNIIQTDIPVKSLKPFLDYLYYHEVSGPIADPQIAIDLLKAGHKYDVKKMETKMEKILLDFPLEAFTPDESISMFLFVRNLEKFQQLKIKVGGILQRWRCFPDRVSESEEFKKLFESPFESEAAKDLILILLDYMWKNIPRT